MSRHVAAALLALTAVAQIAMATCGSLTPSKGGGFGLFSTVDKMENRILLAHADGAELHFTDFEYERQNALAFPTERALDRLASLLAAREDRTVTVEVWKRAFDPAAGECRRLLVARRTVPRAR